MNIFHCPRIADLINFAMVVVSGKKRFALALLAIDFAVVSTSPEEEEKKMHAR
jgi:hypothetical protein